MRFIRNFMLDHGPGELALRLPDLLRAAALFHADESLFQTGWFIESLATQVLVIFVIRTRGSPFASRPSAALAVTSLAVIAVALALPFTPAAAALGFEAPPPLYFGVLVVLVVAYLALAETAKRVFYRRLARG